MDNTIIQWNANGLTNRHAWLSKLIDDTNPAIICIQETNFKDQNFKSLKNHNCYHKNRMGAGSASGGVAIYVTESIYQSEITITTNLEAVAVSVLLDSKKLCICNIYLPDSYTFSQQELQDLVDQLPTPFILVGDFNSRSPLWGSRTHDARGKIIEEILHEINLILFNSTQHTYLYSATGNYTNALDLLEAVLNDLFSRISTTATTTP